MSEGLSLGSILLNPGPGEWQGKWFVSTNDSWLVIEFGNNDINRSMWKKEATINIR